MMIGSIRTGTVLVNRNDTEALIILACRSDVTCLVTDCFANKMMRLDLSTNAYVVLCEWDSEEAQEWHIRLRTNLLRHLDAGDTGLQAMALWVSNLLDQAGEVVEEPERPIT